MFLERGWLGPIFLEITGSRTGYFPKNLLQLIRIFSGSLRFVIQTSPEIVELGRKIRIVWRGYRGGFRPRTPTNEDSRRPGGGSIAGEGGDKERFSYGSPKNTPVKPSDSTGSKSGRYSRPVLKKKTPKLNPI